MKKNMVEENFCRPTFSSSVLCSNDFQTNKKSIELDAENTKLARTTFFAAAISKC